VRDVWRAMFPTRTEESEAGIVSDESIQRRLQRVHAKSGAYDIVHRTLYPVHQRVAEAYRRGRVFLAGDAAHLNNPLGGMGMNGGVHDAFNLAGKLAAVIRGERPVDELERYERQRKPVALEYVNRITIANKRHLEMHDAGEQRRWREELERAMSDRSAEREYMLRLSMIASLRKYECA
jgi:3-(3-hydroxy-phenyl)propionate hydroxylase